MEKKDIHTRTGREMKILEGKTWGEKKKEKKREKMNRVIKGRKTKAIEEKRKVEEL